MKMVKAEGLTYEYTKIMETDHGTEENRVVALKNVNIEIEKGEFVVVLGHRKAAHGNRPEQGESIRERT